MASQSLSPPLSPFPTLSKINTFKKCFKKKKNWASHLLTYATKEAVRELISGPACSRSSKGITKTYFLSLHLLVLPPGSYP